MSQYSIRAEQRLMADYAELVMGCADQAVRWEAEDGKGLLQLKHAEFSIQDNDGKYVEPGALGTVHYYMDLYVKLSAQERKESGQQSAGILVDLADDDTFDVIDEYGRLEPWVGDTDDAGYGFRVVELLMKEVREVKADGLLVPAGQRGGEYWPWTDGIL